MLIIHTGSINCLYQRLAEQLCNHLRCARSEDRLSSHSAFLNLAFRVFVNSKFGGSSWHLGFTGLDFKCSSGPGRGKYWAKEQVSQSNLAFAVSLLWIWNCSLCVLGEGGMGNNSGVYYWAICWPHQQRIEFALNFSKCSTPHGKCDILCSNSRILYLLAWLVPSFSYPATKNIFYSPPPPLQLPPAPFPRLWVLDVAVDSFICKPSALFCPRFMFAFR